MAELVHAVQQISNEWSLMGFVSIQSHLRYEPFFYEKTEEHQYDYQIANAFRNSS